MPSSQQNLAEEWRPIPGFIGYEVSNFGAVRSFRSANGRGQLAAIPRSISTRPTPNKEYLRIGIQVNGKQVHIPVHVAVLLAFKGPRPSSKHDGCHGDGNVRNNHLTNLRWGTKQDNADDRAMHGTQVRGEAVALAVLTEQQVQEIKAALPSWKKGMGRKFARRFGVGDSTISAVKRGQTWNHL